MAETQSLSVLLQLKDQMSAQMGQVTGTVKDLNKELSDLTVKAEDGGKSFSGISDRAKEASKHVEAAGSSFDGLTKKQTKMIFNLGIMAAKMGAASIAMNTLSESAGDNKLGKSIGEVVGALGKFAMIATLMPGPIGLVIGSVTAAVSIFKAMKKESVEAAESLKKFKEEYAALKEESFRETGKFMAKRSVSSQADQLRMEIRAKDEINQSYLERQYEEKAKIGEKQDILRAKLSKVSEESPEGYGFRSQLFVLASELRIVDSAIEEAIKTKKEFDRELSDIDSIEAMNKSMTSLDKTAAETALALELGLITPLAASAKMAEIATDRLIALSKVKDRMSPDDFKLTAEGLKRGETSAKASHAMEDLISEGTKTNKIIQENDVKRTYEIRKEVSNITAEFNRAGISINASREEMEGFAAAALDGKVNVGEFIRQLEEARDHDFFGGMKKGIEDVSSGLLNFRHIFGSMFQDIQSGMSNAFEEAIGNVHKWKDAMSGFADSMKKTFIKAIAEMASQSVMKNLLGGFSALFGGSSQGGYSGGGQSGMGRPSGNSSLSGGLGVGAIAGGFSGAIGQAGDMGTAGASGYEGLAGGDFSGVAGGVVGGAAGIAGVMGAKNAGQGAMSGAMAGAALGTMVFPGIGTVVGLAVGAIAGAFMGNRNKRRIKRAKRRAEAYARMIQLQQAGEAAQLFKTATRTRMGGALALPEATDEVSKLFSGDVTGQEMLDMGPGVVESILGQKQAIQSQAANNAINMGSPIINVSVGSIASSYDAQKLAEDLGFHLTASIQSAGAG
jgi:hypothetical protein